jgi:hypothetical protein
MSIHRLLGLRRTASEKEVRERYLRRLIELHPDRNGGASAQYLQLREAHERYASGEIDENCYMLCSREEAGGILCRCGAKFVADNERMGRIDCDFCSCFVEIQDAPFALEG